MRLSDTSLQINQELATISPLS